MNTSNSAMKRSPGRPKEIGDDWFRVESWFPPEMYAEIRAWVEVRKDHATRVGESASKISIRTEVARSWAKFFEALPAETRAEILSHPKYQQYAPPGAKDRSIETE